VVTVGESYGGILSNVVQVTTDEGATGVYIMTSQIYPPVSQPPGYPIYLPLVLRDY
jgi:hypothetical protein